MPTITVGVDVGKASHQAAAYDVRANRIVAQLTFPVSRVGFERFRAFLARLAPAPADRLVGWRRPGMTTGRWPKTSRATATPSPW